VEFTARVAQHLRVGVKRRLKAALDRRKRLEEELADVAGHTLTRRATIDGLGSAGTGGLLQTRSASGELRSRTAEASLSEYEGARSSETRSLAMSESDKKRAASEAMSRVKMQMHLRPPATIAEEMEDQPLARAGSGLRPVSLSEPTDSAGKRADEAASRMRTWSAGPTGDGAGSDSPSADPSASPTRVRLRRATSSAGIRRPSIKAERVRIILDEHDPGEEAVVTPRREQSSPSIAPKAGPPPPPKRDDRPPKPQKPKPKRDE
jgi:hypothetical protein